jgi:GLPGLI family protein
MKTFFILFIIIFSCFQGHSQNVQFLTQGRIEFERKFNVYSVLDPNDYWVPGYKQSHQQFRTMHFNLDFKDQTTLYYPTQDDESTADGLTGLPAQSNTIFTELKKYMSVTQKKIYEKSYLIEDSIRVIHWKTTSEKREIAGMQCKRANAVIMDSVYVVAFYSEEIVTIGGPESFSGLPGMIMGLAIPQLHISWFATKITGVNVPVLKLEPPTQGVKTTNAVLKKNIAEIFRSKGKFAGVYYNAALL